MNCSCARRFVLSFFARSALSIGLAASTVMCGKLVAQVPSPPSLVLLDTDIGDDIDDVLALGLLLQSPEVKVIGISSAWGDTETRSRMLDRLLRETGHTEIPVATGIVRHHAGEATFLSEDGPNARPTNRIPPLWTRC